MRIDVGVGVGMALRSLSARGKSSCGKRRAVPEPFQTQMMRGFGEKEAALDRRGRAVIDGCASDESVAARGKTPHERSPRRANAKHVEPVPRGALPIEFRA